MTAALILTVGLLVLALADTRRTLRRAREDARTKLDNLHAQLEHAQDDYEFVISGERPNGTP